MMDRSVTPLLDRVNVPADMKAFSDADLRRLAVEVRAETISAVSVTGGHLGAGLDVVDRFAIDRAGLVGADGATHAGGLKFRSMVLPDVFIDQAGPVDMYRVAGLNAAAIEAKVLGALGVAVAGKRA